MQLTHDAVRAQTMLGRIIIIEQKTQQAINSTGRRRILWSQVKNHQ